MSWNIALYNLLVNRVPGIQERYRTFRGEKTGFKRAAAWGYLIRMNLQHYLLKKEFKQSRDFEWDERICLLNQPESRIKALPSPEVFAQKLKDFDVISFDVFDTLILRKFADPTDVFYLVQEELKYPDLKAIRKNAEYLAREERRKQKGDNEVTWEEIWRKTEELSGIPAQKGLEKEWKAEQQCCFGNPYFLELVDILKTWKKKIIVCSDMYMGETAIRELLHLCGYPEFDRYFVSCDYRLSKSKGDLYPVIRKEAGRDGSLCHIGDNPCSDKTQAEKNGIRAFLYPNVNTRGEKFRARDMSPIMRSVYAGIINNRIYNGTEKKSMEYEFGFIYGGLFVTGYCQFIHRHAKEENIDRLLFLARDGDVLLKAYSLLYPEEREKCAYVYWSRLASAKMCARYFKWHYIERMILHKTDQNYSFASVFETMEISDMLSLFLTETDGAYHADTILGRTNSRDLLDFTERHREEILRHYDAETEEGKAYFSEILGDARKAFAIDVGWVGSGAMILKYLVEEVWKFPCEIKGLLAGSCDGNMRDHEISEIQLLSGELKAYLFAPNLNRDLWMRHNAAKGHNLLVELLLASPDPSFRGFTRKKDGNYDFARKKEKLDAREIQRGILDFVRAYAEHPLKDIEISGRDAAAPIMVLYHNEQWVNHLIHQSEIKANIE